MIFIANRSLPLDFTGKYFHFAHRNVNRNQCEFVDLRIFMQERQDFWQNELVEWHSRLSAVACRQASDWWISPGSRLLGVYPSAIQNFLLAVAIFKVSAESPLEKFCLVGFPSEVSNYLNEMGHIILCDNPYIDKPIKRCLGAVKRFLFDSIKMLIYSAKNYQNANRVLTKCPIIIYSHLLGIAKDIDMGDHFYGDMLQDCPNILNRDKLWVYFNDSTVPFTRTILANLEQRLGSKVVILQDFISLRKAFCSILRSVKCWLRLRRVLADLPPMTCAGITSARAALDFYRSTIEYHFPLTEIAIESVFDEVLKKTGGNRIIIPYEEKPLERAIINSCKRMKWHVRIIGLAHGTYNPVHLCLRRSRSNNFSVPRPNLIATTGKIASEVLHEWANIPLAELVPVGSKRYSDPLPRNYLGERSGRLLKVLILISLQDELPTLAGWCEFNSGLFKGCELTIRKYPYSWQEQQDAGIARMREAGVLLKVGEGPLTGQFAACDVALFSTTSTGFEAMLAGIYTMHCNWNSFLSFDPLAKSRMVKVVPHCHDAVELVKALQRLREFSQEEYILDASKQIEFAKTVYSPIDKQAISEILGQTSHEKHVLEKKLSQSNQRV